MSAVNLWGRRLGVGSDNLVASANVPQSHAKTGRLLGFQARLQGSCEIPPTLLSEASHWMLHSSRKVLCCASRSSEGGSAPSSRHRVRVSGAISTARSEGEHPGWQSRGIASDLQPLRAMKRTESLFLSCKDKRRYAAGSITDCVWEISPSKAMCEGEPDRCLSSYFLEAVQERVRALKILILRIGLAACILAGLQAVGPRLGSEI